MSRWLHEFVGAGVPRCCVSVYVVGACCALWLHVRTRVPVACLMIDGARLCAPHQADAEFYKISRAAAGNKELLTPEYMRLTMAKAIASNTKVFFGTDIPTMLASGDGVMAGASPPQQECRGGDPLSK